MLDALRPGLPRRRALLGCAIAALALSTSSCAALFTGTQSATVEFPVIPNGDGTFFGWTETTVGADISSVSSATLLSVVVDTETPEGTPDLTYIGSLKGEAVVGTTRTTVVTQTQFPAGEQAVILNQVYFGDLHPLFKDERTIRIEWTGTINPAFTAWPPDGFKVRGSIQIDIE
jgi:hypothetical protein